MVLRCLFKILKYFKLHFLSLLLPLEFALTGKKSPKNVKEFSLGLPNVKEKLS